MEFNHIICDYVDCNNSKPTSWGWVTASNGLDEINFCSQNHHDMWMEKNAGNFWPDYGFMHGEMSSPQRIQQEPNSPIEYKCRLSPYITDENKESVIKNVMVQFQNLGMNPQITAPQGEKYFIVSLGHDEADPTEVKRNLSSNYFIDQVSTPTDAVVKRNYHMYIPMASINGQGYDAAVTSYLDAPGAQDPEGPQYIIDQENITGPQIEASKGDDLVLDFSGPHSTWVKGNRCECGSCGLSSLDDHHGSKSTYQNYGCRCNECAVASKGAYAGDGLELARDWVMSNPDSRFHGTKHWAVLGCNCHKCVSSIKTSSIKEAIPYHVSPNEYVDEIKYEGLMPGTDESDKWPNGIEPLVYMSPTADDAELWASQIGEARFRRNMKMWYGDEDPDYGRDDADMFDLWHVDTKGLPVEERNTDMGVKEIVSKDPIPPDRLTHIKNFWSSKEAHNDIPLPDHVEDESTHKAIAQYLKWKYNWDEMDRFGKPYSDYSSGDINKNFSLLHGVTSDAWGDECTCPLCSFARKVPKGPCDTCGKDYCPELGDRLFILRPGNNIIKKNVWTHNPDMNEYRCPKCVSSIKISSIKEAVPYHVSPSHNRESIEEEGLSPYAKHHVWDKEHPWLDAGSNIYLSPTADDANDWARLIQTTYDENPPKEFDLYHVDTHELPGLRPTPGMTDVGKEELVVKNRISPERITHIKRFDPWKDE
jgi:hypothetical protein